MSDAEDGDSPTLELSVIAVPLAGKKLVKKLHKVVKKAAASKILKRGVKEVVKYCWPVLTEFQA
jgi:H/ACA ribonucleoprotein complex subunit 2